MPKYSVDEVLDIIKTLTQEEKNSLKAQLPAVLGNPETSSNSPSGQSQTNSVSGVNFGSGSNAFNFAPQQAGRDATSAVNINQPLKQGVELEEVLGLLARLRQKIRQSEILDPLVKAGAEAQVERVEAEIKKPEPDKGLVGRTVATLKQGLEGIQTLAGPTTAVASLVAKAWGIPIP